MTCPTISSQESCGLCLKCTFLGKKSCFHKNRLFPRHILHLTKTLPGLSHCWYLLEWPAERHRYWAWTNKYMIFNYRIIWFFFWLHCVAYGILVPHLVIEPVPPALEVQSPNHWISREVPNVNYCSANIWRPSLSLWEKFSSLSYWCLPWQIGC